MYLCLRMLSLVVLILVLVEHTLGEREFIHYAERKFVLILVLVEHTLGGPSQKRASTRITVLILVLVEHTLGAALNANINRATRS